MGLNYYTQSMTEETRVLSFLRPHWHHDSKKDCLVSAASSPTEAAGPLCCSQPPAPARRHDREAGPLGCPTHTLTAWCAGLAWHPATLWPFEANMWLDTTLAEQTSPRNACQKSVKQIKFSEMLPAEEFPGNICHDDRLFLTVPMEEYPITDKKSGAKFSTWSCIYTP